MVCGEGGGRRDRGRVAFRQSLAWEWEAERWVVVLVGTVGVVVRWFGLVAFCLFLRTDHISIVCGFQHLTILYSSVG